MALFVLIVTCSLVRRIAASAMLLIWSANLATIACASVSQVPLMRQDDWHAFGFDLTPAYATVAVSYANGSNIALARIEGDDAWRDLMCGLTLNEGTSHAECSWGGYVKDTAVSTISNMLDALVAITEERIGERIQSAAVNVPCMHESVLSEKLLRRAFLAADLKYLEIVSYSSYGECLIYPENSILAGHGLGLCQPYNISSYTCAKGDANNAPLPTHVYLLIGYFDNELEMIITHDTTFAYGIYPLPAVDFHLGLNARHRNPDEAYYWEKVREFLSYIFIMLRPEPTRVIVYGDHAADQKLRQMIMRVLHDFLPEDQMPVWIDDGLDPVYVGALGAAEFAKRQPFWRGSLDRGHDTGA